MIMVYTISTFHNLPIKLKQRISFTRPGMPISLFCKLASIKQLDAFTVFSFLVFYINDTISPTCATLLLCFIFLHFFPIFLFLLCYGGGEKVPFEVSDSVLYCYLGFLMVVLSPPSETLHWAYKPLFGETKLKLNGRHSFSLATLSTHEQVFV